MEKICTVHKEKLVSFCVSPSCTLKPLCSLCIVQHMREVHGDNSAFGDIQLLNLDAFVERCRDKLEKSLPKYRSFCEELGTFSQTSSKKLVFERLMEKTHNIKRKMMEILETTFSQQIEQYRDFHQKQSLQIAEKLSSLREKISSSTELIEKMIEKAANAAQVNNSEFAFLQRIFTESLDLELEKKRTIFQKLGLELQHINMQTVNTDTNIEAFLKGFSQDLSDFLARLLVKTTANTSLVGNTSSPSFYNETQTQSRTDIMAESVIFSGLCRKESEEKSLRNANFIGSMTNLMTIKTEDDDEQKSDEVPASHKIRSFTPNVNKPIKLRNKNRLESPKIEELIEEENQRLSIIDKKKKTSILCVTPQKSPIFECKSALLVPKKHQREPSFSGVKSPVFPEKSFKNYWIYLSNLAYKKHNILLLPQEFTRKIASLKAPANPKNPIFQDFQTMYKTAQNLKKPPQNIGFLYQDFAGEYFFLIFPFDFQSVKTIPGLYLLFNEETGEKIEKFRYFANGAKVLLGEFSGKEVEVSYREIWYDLPIARNSDLLRLAIVYHIMNQARWKNELNDRVYLTMEEMVEFKREYITSL